MIGLDILCYLLIPHCVHVGLQAVHSAVTLEENSSISLFRKIEADATAGTTGSKRESGGRDGQQAFGEMEVHGHVAGQHLWGITGAELGTSVGLRWVWFISAQCHMSARDCCVFAP